MLSGVSHDLRTPLTRMKLSLNMADETEDAKDLLSDINQMEHILNTFLDFSKGDTGEDATKLNVKKFAKQIVRDRKRLNHKVKLKFGGNADENATVFAKETALSRAVNNLLSNAFRYANTTSLTVDIAEQSIRFIVEDDGPGIPKVDREKALNPFERLDLARNQNVVAGSGLGLSITSDIARNHGGKLTLAASRSLGGLEACIEIPR